MLKNIKLFDEIIAPTIRRWRFVSVITIIFTIVPIAIMINNEDIVNYEAKIKIKIGRYKDIKGDIQLIENNNLKQNLYEEYKDKIQIEDLGKGEYVLTTIAGEINNAKRIANKVKEEIEKRHQKELCIKKREFEILIEFLQEQILLLKNYIETNQKLAIENYLKEKNNIIIYDIPDQLFIKYLDRREKLFKIEKDVEKDFIPTKISSVKISKNVIKKKIKLTRYTILSALVGLLIGIWTSFCLTYKQFLNGRIDSRP